MKTKVLINIFLVLFFALSVSACSLISKKSDIKTENKITPTALQNQNNQDKSLGDDKFAAINTKYGQIVVKLYKKEAPNTVANFIQKADSSFYNNLIFHRVEPGFVVQGGDPFKNGTGGGTIASEINNIPFKRGSIGLARGRNREISNDSQFFICLADSTCSQLTGDYVNFGEVVLGMDFVDSIKIGDKILEITSKTK